jgi:hypothetical protein
VASVSFSGFFLRRFMRSRIQLRMLLCVTQAAKKLQAKSFFWREMREKLVQGCASDGSTVVCFRRSQPRSSSKYSFIRDFRRRTRTRNSAMRSATSPQSNFDPSGHGHEPKKLTGHGFAAILVLL